MTDEEIAAELRSQWRKGYRLKILDIIRHRPSRATVVLFKVTCERDGMTEYRCKTWGAASQGAEIVTRRKW